MGTHLTSIAARLRLDDDRQADLLSDRGPQVNVFSRRLDRKQQCISRAEGALVPRLQLLPPPRYGEHRHTAPRRQLDSRAVPDVAMQRTSIPSGATKEPPIREAKPEEVGSAMLHRRPRIGYGRARQHLDRMESEGLIRLREAR